MDQEKQIPKYIHFIYQIEGFLKLNFLICFLFYKNYCLLISILICFFALLRLHKIPKFNKIYLKKLILSEFFHNIIYAGPFIFFQYLYQQIATIIYYLILFPLAIHFYVGLCDFIFLKYQTIYRIFPRIIDYVMNNSKLIIYKKCKFEVGLLFFLFFTAFFSQDNFLLFILYGNFIRLKYHFNQNTIIIFSNLNKKIENFTQKCPKPIGFIIGKLKQIFRLLGPKY